MKRKELTIAQNLIAVTLGNYIDAICGTISA